MQNLTEFSSVILTAYFDVGNVKYLYFIILLVLYVCIIVANVLLISVVYMDRTLHEPMYLFLCSLCVNELYGSLGLFPCLLVNMLSDSHELQLTYCYLQVYCLYTYGTVEFCNLALMSYDRYVSICHPLQYNNIMTPTKVTSLIVFVWLFSCGQFVVTLSLTVQLRLCGNIVEKVWCGNHYLVRQGCSDPTIVNIYGICLTILLVVCPLGLIVQSYVRIFKVTFSFGPNRKSLNTCIPHIVSLLNYAVGVTFEVFSSRGPKVDIPPMLNITISVYFLIIPPLVNPIMFGLKLTKIQDACKKFYKRVILLELRKHKVTDDIHS